MRSALLREALERHRRVLKADLVHLIGDEQGCLLTSATARGLVMQTELAAVPGGINCTVSAEVLLSLVHGGDDVRLVHDGATLRVECGRARGTVPSDAEEPPEFPRPQSERATRLTADDARWLRESLSIVQLSSCSEEGTAVVASHEGELRACMFDASHGAFAFRPSQSANMRVGLAPSDARVLGLVLGENTVFAPTDDNRLVVRTRPDSLVLPCVEADILPRREVYGSTRAHWRCQAEHLLDAVQAVATVARARRETASSEPAPARITATERGIRVSTQSRGGTLERAVPAQVRHAHPGVGLNVTLLADVIGRMSKASTITGYVEPGTQSARIIFETERAAYALLTSSE